MPITINSVVKIVYQLSSQALRQEVSGESVFLDMDKGQYFELNSTGNEILDHLLSGQSESEVRDWLVHEYDVTPQQAEKDIQEILEELLKKNLIIKLP